MPLSSPISVTRICSWTARSPCAARTCISTGLKFIWNGACYERLSVRNFGDRPIHLRLTYRFASDFADLFEVRGEHRAARGEEHSALESDHGVLLRYLGLDKVERVTQVAFFPAPKTLTSARAAYELALKP